MRGAWLLRGAHTGAFPRLHPVLVVLLQSFDAPSPEPALSVLGTIKLIAEAGSLVRHAATKVGVITYCANRYEITEIIDGGATLTKYVRDSTADQMQPFRRAK